MKHISHDRSKSQLTKVRPEDVQPNATDVRLSKVFKVDNNSFVLDENSREHRGSTEVCVESDGYFHLEPGTYEVVMENEISVGEGEAGFLITRSTLNRNGIFIKSSLYDSMYSGVLGGVMYVSVGLMKVKPGTRIAQYIMWESEMIGSGYDGEYGNNSVHDEKYS